MSDSLNSPSLWLGHSCLRDRVSNRSSRLLTVLLAVALVSFSFGCSRSKGPGAAKGKTMIQDTGSDTMVNLAQAWAEIYATVEPSVSVEVSGGGSGTGIAALISGTVNIANCSRRFEPQEIASAKPVTTTNTTP